MPFRQAQAAAQLRARNRALAGKPPLRFKRPPKPFSIRNLENDYRLSATQSTDFLAESVKEIIIPALPALERMALVRVDDTRIDAPQWMPFLQLLLDDVRSRWSSAEPQRLERSIEKIGRDVSSTNLASIRRQMRSVLGVDAFISEPDLADVLESFIAEGQKHLGDLSEKTLTDIQRTIISGFRNGVRAEAIAEEIGKRTEIGASRARLIAVDQVQKLNGALTRSRQIRLGFKQYIWRTVRDRAVRPAHAAREGMTFSWDDPPSDGHPGEPINCRCHAEPVFDDLLD